MGCGSSSLKGDPPIGVGGDADSPQPVRKVRTNFSTVDYDQDSSANKKRRMTEYAPEDTIRNMSHASSGGGGGWRASAEGPPVGPGAGASVGGAGGQGEKMELEPYQTREAEARDLSDIAGASYPHENPRLSATGGRPVVANGHGDGAGMGLDPTSDEAKDRFAEANDPLKQAGGAGGDGGLAPLGEGEGQGEEKKRKESWLGRIRDRRGEISEEDMVKYTGKPQVQMKEYATNSPGVGARQSADGGMVSPGTVG